MRVVLLMPNRDDPSRPPLVAQEWSMDTAPRQGEMVALLGEDGESESEWIVKWVRHNLMPGQPAWVDVRLIEPGVIR